MIVKQGFDQMLGIYPLLSGLGHFQLSFPALTALKSLAEA